MKIAPLKVTDPWFHRALGDPRTQAEALRGVPVDTVVQMEQVEILHHGPDLNYRPYLHLSGVAGEVEPDVALPYGITELVFRQGGGPVVDAFYEFDNTQLADLVAKDYFGPGFQVPSAMVGIPWTLPGTADFLVVAPEYADEVPLVFIGLQHQNDLALTEENSGYNLAEYFPDYTMDENTAQRRNQPDIRTRSDEMRDMFSAEDLGSQPEGPQRLSNNVPAGVFDQLVAEMERQRSQEEELAAAQYVHDPRTAAGMYHSRIGPGVNDALAPEEAEEKSATPVEGLTADAEARATLSRPVVAADDAFLDLGSEDADIGIAPLSNGGIDRRREAGRRNVRLRATLAAADEQESNHGEEPDL